MALAELGAPALFLAGVAASPHCSLMCGPLQLTQLRGGSAVLSRAAWLHGGRVLGYAALGAVGGAAGAQLANWLPAVQAGAWVRTAAALLMCAIGIGLLFARRRGCCAARIRAPGRRQALLRGVTWSLMPCGMLYATLLLAALAGSAVGGAALMAAFGLGTVPLSLGSALALRRISLPQAALQRWAAGILLGFGGLSIVAIWIADDVAGWCRVALA